MHLPDQAPAVVGEAFQQNLLVPQLPVFIQTPHLVQVLVRLNIRLILMNQILEMNCLIQLMELPALITILSPVQLLPNINPHFLNQGSPSFLRIHQPVILIVAAIPLPVNQIHIWEV